MSTLLTAHLALTGLLLVVLAVVITVQASARLVRSRRKDRRRTDVPVAHDRRRAEVYARG